MPINVTLAPELEAFVHQKIASGEYASVSDVLNEALNLWRDEEQEEEELRREIARGLEDFERGAYTTCKSEEERTAFFEQVKANGRKLRAEREKKSA